MDYQSTKYNPHSFDSKVSKYFITAVAVAATSLTLFYLDGLGSKDDAHRRNVLQFTQYVRALIMR